MPKGGSFAYYTGALNGMELATFQLGHNYYRLTTEDMDEEECSNCLYDLDNGDDTTGTVNRDLYLAFNRVVSGRSDRNGAGTCEVKLSWECNIP